MAKPVFNDAIVACLDADPRAAVRGCADREGGRSLRQAGSLAEAVTVSMDIEQLIYEAGRLHDAASLLNRLSRTEVSSRLPRPAPSPGSCQWQHMMLSLKRWRARWPPSKPKPKSKSAKSSAKPTRSLPIKASQRRKASRLHQRLPRQPSRHRTVFQTGDRARPAPPAQGHDDRRDHEGDGLAAALGARLLCRCGQEEAEAEPRLRRRSDEQRFYRIAKAGCGVVTSRQHSRR